LGPLLVLLESPSVIRISWKWFGNFLDLRCRRFLVLSNICHWKFNQITIKWSWKD
jgi:hypothetical protein